MLTHQKTDDLKSLLLQKSYWEEGEGTNISEWSAVALKHIRSLAWSPVLDYKMLSHKGRDAFIVSITEAKEFFNEVLEKHKMEHDMEWLKTFLDEREDLETKFRAVSELFGPEVFEPEVESECQKVPSNKDEALRIDENLMEVIQLLQKILKELTEFKFKTLEHHTATDVLAELCSVAGMST